MEYREQEILQLLVRLLNRSIRHVGYPPYNYEVFLNMEPKEALKELSFRLRRIRDVSKGAKTGFRYYFSTEREYAQFLIESALAECLNVFFILKKQKQPIPPLYIESEIYRTDKEFSIQEMSKIIPFRSWLKKCQGKKITRAVAK